MVSTVIPKVSEMEITIGILDFTYRLKNCSLLYSIVIVTQPMAVTIKASNNTDTIFEE